MARKSKTKKASAKRGKSEGMAENTKSKLKKLVQEFFIEDNPDWEDTLAYIALDSVRGISPEFSDDDDPGISIFKTLARNNWDWDSILMQDKIRFTKQIITKMKEKGLLEIVEDGILIPSENIFIQLDDAPELFGELSKKTSKSVEMLKIPTGQKQKIKKLIQKVFKEDNPDWQLLVDNPESAFENLDFANPSRAVFQYLSAKDFDWEKVPEKNQVALVKRLVSDLIKRGLLELNSEGIIVLGPKYEDYMEN